MLKAKRSAANVEREGRKPFFIPDALLPYDKNDVIANHAGHLSARQIEKLYKIREACVVIDCLCFIFVLPFIIALASKVGGVFTAPEALGLLGCVYLAIAARIAWVDWRIITAEIAVDSVMSVTGAIRLLRSRNSRTPTPGSIQVENETFFVTNDLLRSLKNVEHTVYFTPRLKIFLSAEQADAAQDYATKAKHGEHIHLGDDGELILQD